MEWISVEERLPAIGERVRMMHPAFETTEVYLVDATEQVWFHDRTREVICGVTHWAPLTPDAPEPDGWISVEERLPKTNGCYETRVDQFGDQTHANYWDGTRFQIDTGYTVLHWRPFPEPPKLQGPFEPRARDICGRIFHSVCYRGVRQWDVDRAEWAQDTCDKLNKLWAQDKGANDG